MAEKHVIDLVMTVNKHAEETAMQQMMLRNFIIVMCRSMTEEQKNQVRWQMRQIHQVTDAEYRDGDVQLLEKARRDVEIMLELIN
ncbi:MULTISPECIES: hypothetical protein [Rahnella]|jgi:hypothetical protein|uniref:Uncharacterized protein n=2 Tax=Rahnella TaxID=34037 RepID=A0A419NFJ5_9GAMM|nr:MULTISPECIES: hypothetical protein [Rahnella]MDH2899184.1 hypothetical protein [Rahnella variigena]RJT47654.1 hypothetical protein D6C13_01200 [Rahnella woolbedingensis]RJT51808.1 hypothetical protein D6D38_16470 [Rahnella variigena]RKF69736.1 hypothetical protein CKQ54_15735 [Rahnella variigena]RYJ12359.1 hypothetical protein C5Y41_23065 [Rahnella variigena]